MQGGNKKEGIKPSISETTDDDKQWIAKGENQTTREINAVKPGTDKLLSRVTTE
jgi:hypothetical protein